MPKDAQQIEAAFGCSIDIAPGRTNGVWLYSRTATKTNDALFLPPDAVDQLVTALLLSRREMGFWRQVAHEVKQFVPRMRYFFSTGQLHPEVR